MLNLVLLGALLAMGGGEFLGIPTKSIPPARKQFNHLRMPAHGIVYKGLLYGFLDDAWSLPGENGRPDWRFAPLDGIPLENTEKNNWKKHEFLRTIHGWNFRFHIEYGYVWNSRGPSGLAKLSLEELRDFDPVAQNRTKKDPRWSILPGFGLQTLYNKYSKIHHEQDPSGAFPIQFPANGVSGFGSVPTSKNSCICYLLRAAGNNDRNGLFSGVPRHSFRPLLRRKPKGWRYGTP